MGCDESCDIRQYSGPAVVLHNIPYAIMLALGAAAMAVALDHGDRVWIAATGYVLYGIIGALWIILFICPHCPSYGRWSCPCGYGVVASRLRSASDRSLFASKFKRHILFIVPLWFIPLGVGVPCVVRAFSWTLVVLLAIFAVNSFVILPVVSTGKGCKDCPQQAECPWMGKKSAC
jgi:hypothetical protein